MGVIRKTASIATLGVVNFRSKKERLARAERAAELEHHARQVAESGFARVEGELRRLTKAETKAARQLARLRRNRKVRRADQLTRMLAAVQPQVHDGVETARHAVSEMADAGRKRGRKARKAAKRASKDLRASAKDLRASAKSAIDHGRAAMQS